MPSYILHFERHAPDAIRLKLAAHYRLVFASIDPHLKGFYMLHYNLFITRSNLLYSPCVVF